MALEALYAPLDSGKQREISSSDLNTSIQTLLTSPSDSESLPDICCSTDKELAARLEFVKEIGTGCWGTVWSVKPKRSDSLTLWQSQDRPERAAVKLVHRTKQSSTTAVRIRALWSEYKIIRSLRTACHPNLIAFSDFIVTPSYALVTMAYHEAVMQVAVSFTIFQEYCKLLNAQIPERSAKKYFVQLLDAVGFLHRQGYTHNDIKVANILLSSDDRPILIDFGFAQCYQNLDASCRRHALALPAGLGNEILGASSTSTSPKEAFMSNQSWGTPEYLSPERTKGSYHDERLSDIWSLGVTMYEIIVGRTPFEKDESEEFLTKEALEIYYQRTISGLFFGQHRLTADFECTIRSMVKADFRKRIRTCEEVLNTPFFVPPIRRSSRKSSATGRLVRSSPSKQMKAYNGNFKIFVDPHEPTVPSHASQKVSVGKENVKPIDSMGSTTSSARDAFPRQSPAVQNLARTEEVLRAHVPPRNHLVNSHSSIPKLVGRESPLRKPKAISSLSKSMSEIPRISEDLSASMATEAGGSGAEQSAFAGCTMPTISITLGAPNSPMEPTIDAASHSLSDIPYLKRHSSARAVIETSKRSRGPPGHCRHRSLCSPPFLSRQESANSGILDALIQGPVPEDCKQAFEYAEMDTAQEGESFTRTVVYASAGTLSPSIPIVRVRHSIASASIPGVVETGAQSSEMAETHLQLHDESELPSATSVGSLSISILASHARDAQKTVDSGVLNTSVVASHHEPFDEDSDASSCMADGAITRDMDETVMISSAGMTQALEAAGPSHFSTPSPTKDVSPLRRSFDLLRFRPNAERWARDRRSEDELNRVAEVKGRPASPIQSIRKMACNAAMLLRPDSRPETPVRSTPQSRSGRAVARFKSLLRGKWTGR